MATYNDIFNLHNHSELINRVTVACIVAAEGIMAELGTVDNHASRLIWASSVFQNPQAEAKRMYWAVLAANNDAEVAVILAATDAAIQTNVDEHVDLFAIG